MYASVPRAGIGGGSAFLLLQAGFSFGILYYDYLAQNHWALVDTIGNPHLIMALSGSMIVVFVLLKVGLYQMVNSVFFPKNTLSPTNKG